MNFGRSNECRNLSQCALNRFTLNYCCYLVITVLCIFLAPAVAQIDESKSTSTFEEIELDLPLRVFKQTLPFDMPFIITGTVPTGTRVVKVLYEESKDEKFQNKWTPAKPLFWQKHPGIDTKRTTFRIKMPDLEAERYYNFKVVLTMSLSKKDLTAFKQKVERLIDKFMLKIRAGDISEEESKALREVLIDELITSLGQDLVIVPETIFDPELTDEKVHEAFQEASRQILEPQFKSDANIKNYFAAKDQFAEQIERLFFLDSSLKNLADLIAKEKKANNQAIIKLFAKKEFQQALDLSKLDSNQLVLLTQGGKEKLSELANTIDSSEITKYIASYEQTYKLLDSLKSLINHFVANKYLDNWRNQNQLDQNTFKFLKSLADSGGKLISAKNTAFGLIGIVKSYKTHLDGRSKAISAMASSAKIEIRSETVVFGTTINRGQTPQRNYISADGGILCARNVGIVPYIGTNIYLRPINKNAPLSRKGTFEHRFAFTVGLTVQSIEDDKTPKTRENLFGSQALVLGAGMRFSESIRLGLGGLIFFKQDTNPVHTEKRIAVNPYLSFSFDWDIVKSFAGIGKLFSG
ncbi:MAG: hypothetical protein ACRBF0_13950 [Calditrichia bacterium]